MLVSVVVPTYNRTELLLNRCLPSIINQSHREIEVLVVGDGTEQATVDAMEDYPDPRVKFWNIPHQIYPENQNDKWGVLGLNALNHGLDQATGEWIAVLADDDEWELDALESLLAETQRSGKDFVYGKAVTPWGQWYGHWPPGPMNFTDGSYIYRRSLDFRYDPDCIKRGLPEDADLWVRMINEGVSFGFLDKLVHRYYPNPR